MVFVVFSPLWLVEDKNCCSFYLQDEGLIDSLLEVLYF